MFGYVIAIGRRLVGYLIAYLSMPRSPDDTSKHRGNRRDKSGRQ
jgi:hypothetical protein